MTKNIRCLIVDDEPLAREAIRTCASFDPSLQIIGEASDGDDAVSAIQQDSPDLVFLDVQMPGMDGFEVLQALEARGLKIPVTVFITAYDQYALRAFEAQALDYLLKPIDEKRFRRALAAAKSRIASEKNWFTAEELVQRLEQSGILRRPMARLPVKSNGRIVFVRLDEIEWIEAEGNYLRLHLEDESYLLRETMNSFEARVDPQHFMRIHRSAIANIDCIKDVQPWFTGEYVVRMKSGKELTLSRKYRDNLRRLLGDSGTDAATATE
jgi:two-component system, LytTR family, response regulator